MVAYRYDGSSTAFFAVFLKAISGGRSLCKFCPRKKHRCPYTRKNGLEPTPTVRSASYTSLSRKISPEARELVETGFLTCLPERERLLYRFIRMGYRHGAQVTSWLADDTVSTLRKAAFSAGHEAHLLTGFLRFSEQNGTLAAIITPKNRVLPLILEHFSSRFNAETFLIYDKTHHMALSTARARMRSSPWNIFRWKSRMKRNGNSAPFGNSFTIPLGLKGGTTPNAA